MMDSFFAFLGLKSALPLFVYSDISFFFSIKWFLPPYLSFHSISFFFFFFFVFLSSTYCGVCLYHRTMVDLFIGFRTGDSNGRAISIKLGSHIKSLFVGMFHLDILGLLIVYVLSVYS